MAPVDIIKKAQSLLAKKEYAKAANLLEPNIISFNNSFQFHYTLGLSFLYLGDIGGAELYFKKARNIKMQDVNLILAQACIFLRKGQVDRSLSYCLDALDIDAQNPYARRFLLLLKNTAIQKLFLSGYIMVKFYDFIPRYQKKILFFLS